MASTKRKRPSDDYAVTISGGADTRIVQFQVSKRTAHVILAGLAVLGLAFVVAVAMMGRILGGLRELDDVRAENVLLRRQVGRMAELEAKVVQLDRTRRDLLRIVGIDEPEEAPQLAGLRGTNQQLSTSTYTPVEPGGALSEQDLEQLGRLITHRPLDGPVTRTYGPLAEAGVFHTGIDVAGDTGSDILAAGNGIVTQIAQDEVFGQVMIIAHEPGVSTMYGHNSKILSAIGDYVTAGQKVAEVGNTGQSSAPHLHFEVHWQQRAIDPALLFAAWRHPGSGAAESADAHPSAN